MSDTPEGFVFDRYALRAAVPQDIALAERWMQLDPFHRWMFTPDFWVQQVSGRVNSFVLEERIDRSEVKPPMKDEDGNFIYHANWATMEPVFFFELRILQRRTVEIYIQFAPEDEVRRMRTMRALKVGWEWLKKRLTGLGYGIVSFRSVNPALVRFFTRQGFEHSGDTLWFVLQTRTNGAVEDGNDVRTNGPAD